MKTSILLKVLPVILFTLIFGNGYSQINPKIYVDPSELTSIMNRKMVIGLMEEDPKEVKRLTKKLEKNPEGLNDYRQEIKVFNDYLKSGIERYWKLNKKFEYKSMSEIKVLMDQEKKENGSKYVILMPGYLTDMDDDVMSRTDIKITALFYHRAELPLRKPDYKAYIPNGNLREKVPFSESDIHFTIIAMQENLNYMKKKGEVVNYDDYIVQTAKENCKKMEGKTILIDTALLEHRIKDIDGKIKEKYKGEYKMVNATQIDSAFSQGTENTAIIMCVPYGLMKGSTLGILSTTLLITAKIAVDCKTHQLLNQHELVRSSFGMMGKTISAEIQPRNVEGVAVCPAK
jgi:hypothetical protein